jgi:hypothetical protein
MDTYKNISTQSNYCIHTKNIYSLADLNPIEEQYKFLNSHLKTCRICAEEYHHFQEKCFAAKTFIPKPMMDKELKETFDRELGDMLKSMQLNKKVLQKKRVSHFVQSINDYGEASFKILFSKSMILSFAVALVMFFVLKNHH